MALSLLHDTTPFLAWNWADIEPYYRDLQAYTLNAETLDAFMAEWSALGDRVAEIASRLQVAVTQDTADAEAERRHQAFLDEIFPQAEQADQRLKEKLLSSGLEPAGFAVPMRQMRAEADLFRAENLSLLIAEEELSTQYFKVIGAQTVEWDGLEITADQLQVTYRDRDRTRRERAWRLEMSRWLADRSTLDDLWRRFLDLRLRMAANADCADYRAFQWQALHRFDYTPEDCLRFHQAIEEVMVPAAARIHDQRRRRLGLDSLRPWDLDVDVTGRAPLRPFTEVASLDAVGGTIFQRVDPAFGAAYAAMRREGLLDLEVRKNKAPGGYCTYFPVAERPFIFMRARGLHDDVQTLLHEGGHAFHAFEATHLPYGPQRHPGAEFSEVASMAMELLASPYLTEREGGFYSDTDAARARVEHLESCILFWPYMAIVDAFQHWAYTHPEDAADPAQCDAQWAMQWRRFCPDVNWEGLEQELITGWHRKMHIYVAPFYYVEYGLAQLGAVQVWANARRDQAGAVAQYRRALALGNTIPFPQLFAAAGARFAFDAATLGEALTVLEETITSLRGD